jgi:hypothetical protein
VRALRLVVATGLVIATCAGAVACTPASAPPVPPPVRRPAPVNPAAAPGLDMRRQIPTATAEPGATTAPAAARDYVVALARGDARRFAAVTGSSVTTSAMESKRRELFGSALRKETMEFTPDQPGAAMECTSIVLQGGALALEDAISSVSPDMADPHRLRILVRAKSPHSWFVLGAEAQLHDGTGSDPDAQVPKKPVILLYPPRPMHVRVRLDLDGHVTVSEPPYDVATRGWSVVAQPDGQLLDKRSGTTCSELFWEGEMRLPADFSTGFVVPRAEIAPFLEDKLAVLGLNAAERAEFIEYWLPRMQAHPFALVHFAGADYERAARLSIDPQPDVTIRVFMEFAPLDRPVAMLPQPLSPAPARTGFTAVEWGGAEVEAPATAP